MRFNLFWFTSHQDDRFFLYIVLDLNTLYYNANLKLQIIQLFIKMITCVYLYNSGKIWSVQACSQQLSQQAWPIFYSGYIMDSCLVAKSLWAVSQVWQQHICFPETRELNGGVQFGSQLQKGQACFGPVPCDHAENRASLMIPVEDR